MTVKVAIGINMSQPHFLILHPYIALALYFQPAITMVMRLASNADMKHLKQKKSIKEKT